MNTYDIAYNLCRTVYGTDSNTIENETEWVNNMNAMAKAIGSPLRFDFPHYLKPADFRAADVLLKTAEGILKATKRTDWI